VVAGGAGWGPAGLDHLARTGQDRPELGKAGEGKGRQGQTKNTRRLQVGRRLEIWRSRVGFSLHFGRICLCHPLLLAGLCLTVCRMFH
jgi:hypothetical protein